MTRVTYDRVLMLDPNPLPNFNHVSCVSFTNSGLTAHELSSKFTREFRLEARQLPIYDTPRVYYVVAKVESNVDYVQELRATTAVNDFIAELKKGGRRPDVIAEYVVDFFKSRVQNRIPYVRKDERDEHPPPQTTRRKRPMVSSDPDDRTPLRQLHLPANGHPLSQPVIPAVAPKKKAKKAVVTNKKSVGVRAAKGNTKKKQQSAPITTPPPPITTSQVPATSQVQAPPPQIALSPNTERPFVHLPTAHDDRQAIVLATSENPIILDPHIANALTSSSPLVGIGANKEFVTQNQTPQGRKKADRTDIDKVIDHIAAFDRKVERRHARFSDSLKFLIKKSEAMEKDINEVKQRLQAFGGQLISAGIASEAKFPFESPDDLMAYMDEDPTMSRAIAREDTHFFSSMSATCTS